MRQRLAFIKHPAIAARRYWRTVHVVQQPFHQVRRRRQVLQPLLVLDPDRGAAEIVRNPQRRDVHLALLENLRIGQLGLFVRPGDELHPLRVQPRARRLRFPIRRSAHLGVQRRLRQPLLEHARGMQQLVGDDRVIHPHATLVENPHDRLVALQLPRQPRAQFARFARQRQRRQRLHVRRGVHDPLALQPPFQVRQEELVVEVLAPQRRIRHARLGQRPVQVQHAHQPGPLPAPVRQRQDRPLMRIQPAQHMVRVLPDGLGHNQRSPRRDRPEHLHAMLLRADEAVLLRFVIRVPALDRIAELPHRREDLLFHRRLRGPAFLVRRKAQVAACN